MRTGALWLLVSMLASAVVAQRPGAPMTLELPHPRLRLLWQNDSWGTASDRFFTNGIELGVTFAADVSTLDWLPFCQNPTAATHEVALGQDMYTPEDFVIAMPDPRDRPYAGWLYGSYRYRVLTLAVDRRDHLDTWEIELGVVGPSSLADDVQIRVHELVNSQRPGGWSHQLRDEPGLLVGYERRFRTWFNDRYLEPFESDLLGVLGVRLGNIESSLRLGTTLRVGIDLPRHFGSALRPAGESGSRWHVEAGVEGRLVMHNIFLDGNSWRSSPSVGRNLFVADFHVGLVCEVSRHLRVSLLETFRTPEFDSPSSSGDLSHFTSLQVEWLF